MDRRCGVGVIVDDTGVTRFVDDGRIERVSWDELVEVRVVARPDESSPCEPFFVLVGASRNGCVLSCGTAGLFDRLLRLASFDSDAVIVAAESRVPVDLRCWSDPDRAPRSSLRQSMTT